MTWGTATRILGILATLAIVTACARPNADGWWDEGAHAVDGYWVTSEQPCEPATDEGCAVAIETATSILHAEDPAAQVTGAVTAGYPMRNGDNPNEMTFTIGGLMEPEFVILDLADGTRRTIGLHCGPAMSEDGSTLTGVTACQPAEFEVWRVTDS